MDELDRLSWAGGIAFACYGVRLGVRVDDPALLSTLPLHLPPARRPLRSHRVDYLYSVRTREDGAAESERTHEVYAGADKIARTADLDEALDTLRSGLDFMVATHARRVLFVHAGVVEWRGRAILLPGRSWSGKSTLVAELVRAGATYYSDEYAVLDTAGRVHPYARPLAIRDPAGGRPRPCPVGQLGGRPGRRPVRVGLVVVTAHRRGARWRPRRLSHGQAVLALLDNTVLARDRPDVALPTLARAIAAAHAVKSLRGEASDTVPSVLAAL